MPTLGDLHQLQALPLKAKIVLSQQRIKEFYDGMGGRVFISFSGGKDSTVLLDLVHEYYPDVPVIFINTGLEYPEIQQFCRKKDVRFIRPRFSFGEVLTRYGYPIMTKEVAESIYYARRILNGENKYKHNRKTIQKRKELLGKRRYISSENGASVVVSKYNKTRWLKLAQNTDFLISSRCCFFMKKSDLGKLHRKENIYPYIGTMTEESTLRQLGWLKSGCNSFDEMYGSSRPLSFWREQDIIQYIKEKNLEYCPVYGDIVCEDGEYRFSGQSRTGCIFCGFGMYRGSKFDKFVELKKTHPRQYEYCLEGGQYIANPNYDPKAPEMDGDWVNWNPEKIWVPSKEGIGMKHVFDQVNSLYGSNFIRY